VLFFTPLLFKSPISPSSCPTAVSCTVLLDIANGIPLQSVAADIRISNGAITPGAPNSIVSECASFVAFPNSMVSFAGIWNSSRILGSWSDPAGGPSRTSPPPLRVLQLVVTGSGLQSASGTIQFNPVSGNPFTTSFVCQVWKGGSVFGCSVFLLIGFVLPSSFLLPLHPVGLSRFLPEETFLFKLESFLPILLVLEQRDVLLM
jgi:hypothetical protein